MHSFVVRKVGRRRALKVLVERETLLDGGVIIVDTLVDARFRVGRHTRLEEVGFTLQRNVLHEVERVGIVVHLVVSERDEQSIGDESNVLAHELFVHAYERDGQSIGQEFTFEVDGFLDDALHGFRMRSSLEVSEEQACKVGVETFISRDQFVGERQSRHEPSLLEPENGCLGGEGLVCGYIAKRLKSTHE